MIVSRILKKQRRTLTIFDLFLAPEFREIYLLLLYGIVIAMTGTDSPRRNRGPVDIPSSHSAPVFLLPRLLRLRFPLREYLILSVASFAVSVAMIFSCEVRSCCGSAAISAESPYSMASCCSGERQSMNKIIHEQSRLRILTLLASGSERLLSPKSGKSSK
jgi:hypothetical protein